MTRQEASPSRLEATRIVFRDVASVLAEYDGAVIVGGNIPWLIVPQEREKHEGTVDIDVVLDPEKLSSDPELTLHEKLERLLFQQSTTKPFRYTKWVMVDGENHEVLLELLGGGIVPPNGLRRIAREDVYVSVIEGMEVALDRPRTAWVDGPIPYDLTVASLPAFLSMKALALEQRVLNKRQKDAYDIVYCLQNYPGGLERIATEFNERMDHPLIVQGKDRLTDLFETTASIGPVAYGTRAQDDEIHLYRKIAHGIVNDLLDRLP